MRHLRFVPLGVAVAALVAAGAASGQEPEERRVSARRLSAPEAEAMRLDGRLDESAWRTAPVAGDFRQREPLEGAPAEDATEVRILYDESHLYVGILARDRQPDRVVARILQRDRLMGTTFDGRPAFAGDDAVAIMLDPFHDHRNGVVFATNPNGAEFDALITDEGREFNIDWRAVWRVAATRVPEGWSAEFAIPFRTLRFPADGRSWGFNVYRMVRRTNEESLWTAWSRSNEGFARISRAGRIEGLTDLPRAGLNIEVKPYVLGGVTEEVDSVGVADTDIRREAGLDLKYEVRPGLLLDVTANTDFAQVEVDSVQVNLTRFDLFFPEKRDFFLENSGIFDFGVRGFFEPPPFLLFFSRRIGIADSGEVPVFGGARLTGRVGRQTIGLLNIVGDSAWDQPRTNFAVARVKRDIGSANYVGAMLTDRRSANSWNTAGGIDGSFWPAPALNLQGFVAHTATAGAGGDGSAYRAGLDYQTDRFGLSMQHLFIGGETTADIGFITRENIRRTNGFARFTRRPQVLGVRNVDLFVSSNYLTRADGVLQDWESGVGLSTTWNSGDSFVLFGTRLFSRLDEEFELDDAVIPPGDYRFWQWGWFANTSPSRPIVLNQQAILQGFYGGTLKSIATTLALVPDPHVAVTLGYTRNAVDVPVPNGTFTANIGSLRISYAFSTRVFVNALIQYNSLDETVSANVRLNIIHRPGSDLFIVFNEQRSGMPLLRDLRTSTLDSRGAVLKITYLARL